MMRWRSCAIASLIAATDFSRPTPSGTTSFGNTTASRRGTSGSSAGNSPFCAVILVSSVIWSCVLSKRVGRSLRLEERRGHTGNSDRPRRPVLLGARRVHLDGARPGAFRLRHNEFQHPVLEAGLDLGRVDGDRKRERALELAGAALLTEPAVLAHIGRALHLARDRDRVAGGVDLDLIRCETRKVSAQVIGILCLPEVDRYRDMARGEPRPRRGTDEALLEETIHGVAERHDVGYRAKTCDGHARHLLSEARAAFAAALRLVVGNVRRLVTVLVHLVQLPRHLLHQVRDVTELQ